MLPWFRRPNSKAAAAYFAIRMSNRVGNWLKNIDVKYPKNAAYTSNVSHN